MLLYRSFGGSSAKSFYYYVILRLVSKSDSRTATKSVASKKVILQSVEHFAQKVGMEVASEEKRDDGLLYLHEKGYVWPMPHCPKGGHHPC